MWIFCGYVSGKLLILLTALVKNVDSSVRNF